MTAIEVALLLIGVVFILGSFFIIEKLSSTELSRVAELSEDELRIVMDRELLTAGAKISDMADEAVDLSLNQIQRRMEKDTNEKIMAISEYSDSVMEKLQKINSEVTFLYSMLGDKHEELNKSMEQMNDLMLQFQMVQAQAASAQEQFQELLNSPVQDAETAKQDFAAEKERLSQSDHTGSRLETEQSERSNVTEAADEGPGLTVKEEILKRYRSGEALNDIARDLGLGFGEVKLIVELYKGEENQ